ncbi:MAG: cytochrome c-type biogenesis protein CcmH [Zoogloea sp.]|uniref:cytochrome c-type biogenesis protein n=1 Tax=Zoogloea sp. TaxID=49181 RepID=UPI002633C9E4|nr:cytochrome c-type biogenesis protein [Zoogloea sp.]MDD2987783.1 cytochrome c-type biogenesis protein CcmH [Zoogloea sp.]
MKALRRTLTTCATALLLGPLAPVTHAGEATPMAENPVVEARLIAISEELRCLVCQNESLAGSRAELAEDLRREVRKLIQDGKTDPEIKDYLVARYGDFVLYRPPVKPTTWLLWFGPFALMGGAVIGLILYLRRRATRVEPSHLSAADRASAEALLADTPPRPKDPA